MNSVYRDDFEGAKCAENRRYALLGAVHCNPYFVERRIFDMDNVDSSKVLTVHYHAAFFIFCLRASMIASSSCGAIVISSLGFTAPVIASSFIRRSRVLIAAA